MEVQLLTTISQQLDTLIKHITSQTPKVKVKLPKIKVPKGSSKSEIIMREILEELTNKKWPSCRPDWLRSQQTGYNLEIDCYCEELKVGFEYMGAQHYKIGKKYVKNENQLVDVQKRDLEKLTLSKTAGITLIRIDGTAYTCRKKDQMRDHIISRLQECELLDKKIN